MTQNKISNTVNYSDNFFVRSLSDLTVAKDFLQQHLPQPLLEALDLSTLRICKDRLVDETLSSRYTDVVFELQLKDSTQTVYVIAHIEHQSEPEADMPVRAFLYESGIIRDHGSNHKQVPLVYTIVYYNGAKDWRYPTDLKALINAPTDLIDRYFLQPFHLVQLKKIPDEVLRKRLWSGLLGLAMKHIYDRDILPALEKFIDMLRQVEQQGRQDFCLSILYYIIKKGEIRDKAAFKTLIDSRLSQETRGEIMTIAQQWREEGREEGLTIAQQWREEGWQEAAKAIRLLEKGFPVEQVAQLTKLPVEIVARLEQEQAEDIT